MSTLKNEVEKFTSIASKWWDYDGPFKLLHEINPLRLSYILQQVKIAFDLPNNNEFSKLKIIDIGCGGGILSIPLARLGFEVKAIDAGRENIDIAIAKAKSENLAIDFQNIDIKDLSDKGEKFDIIICLEVLEHVDNPEEFISYISSLAKKDTLVILSTLNRNLKSKFLAIYMAEYVLNMVPKNTHEYEKFITPYGLKQFCAQNNMSVKDFTGMSFNIISREWEISNDLGVNYFATFKKLDK